MIVNGEDTEKRLTMALSLASRHRMIIVQSHSAHGKRMTTELYNYEPIAQHPKLLALYSGWLGQKIYSLAHWAVTWDQSDYWSAAATEMDRLVLLLHCADKAKAPKLSGETQEALGKLIGYFAAGGWWTSEDGTRERLACKQARLEQEEFSGHDAPDDAPFQPRLSLESDSDYSVAATVINQLDALLMQATAAMDNLDVCRLGASLSGLCHRSTPQLGIPFINSIFNDLAARDITDLQAENNFRRAVNLSEVSEDRRPRSLTDPTPPPPIVPEDAMAGRNRQGLFAPYVEDITDHRDLVLGCVFNRFGVIVPPAEFDASQCQELDELKKRLGTVPRRTTKNPSSGSDGRRGRGESGAPGDHFWVDDAAQYLGADQLGVNARKFIYRLVKKGALPARKINNRFVFFRAELDRVIANGDSKRRPGRPRKTPSA